MKVGCKSYTVLDGKGCRIEVHRGGFYIVKFRKTQADNSPSVNYAKHGGPDLAWEHAKKIPGWAA